MSKSPAIRTSAFILSLMVSGAALAQSVTDPTDLGFPTSPTQLGGNGDIGVGGTRGIGGEGGFGGTTPSLSGDGRQNGRRGENGGSGGPGGRGGDGGSGTWILQNLPNGTAFSNQGTIYIGGLDGVKGDAGTPGLLSGGRGGDGGEVFQGGQDGGEPVPDIFVDTQEGGKGGGVLAKGGNGEFGGGGGGGGGNALVPASLFGFQPGGRGGKGVDGRPGGVGGAAGSGLPGSPETTVTTSPNTNSGSVQIGGSGGDGGEGGSGGSGGGGGGGGGALFVTVFNFFPGLGGRGGAPGEGGAGGDSGDGGTGTVDIRNAATVVNESGGNIVIGRGADGADGTLRVRMGGALTNRNRIDVNENGALDVLGGTVSNESGATITNKGVIDNNGTFVNNGRVESATGSFANFGAYTGTGSYLGTFVNNGVVAPGNSIGTAMIGGDFVNAVTLEVELAGFGSGMHDVLDVTGTANFLEGSLITFLSWEGYGFEDIAPQETKSLEFFRAEGGIIAFLSGIAFGEGFLPDGFAFNVLNDGNSLFLEVSNNVPPIPLPPAIWLFISAILGFGLVTRRRKRL